MQITFSPQRRDDRLSLSRKGDVLTLNGDRLDLSKVPPGGLPFGALDCPWIAGDITRVAGVLCVPLILPHGENAPPDTLFPAPLTLTRNGRVALPPHDAAAPDIPDGV